MQLKVVEFDETASQVSTTSTLDLISITIVINTLESQVMQASIRCSRYFAELRLVARSINGYAAPCILKRQEQDDISSASKSLLKHTELLLP